MTSQGSETVAVLGAGVAGLSAARYLRAEGFEVTVVDGHDGIGGQWDTRNPRSGVWPQMRSNTAAFVTKLSDVRYPDDVPLYPHNRQVLAMLEDFVAVHHLAPHLRLGTEVVALAPDPAGGYRLTSRHQAEDRTERFDRVVVATGRFHRPRIPHVPGLSSFSGAGGVRHTFDYDHPERYRGQRVLVGGGNISSLEIVCDLAMSGAEVLLAQRRQRWVLPKVAAGVPVEYLVMTRGRALAAETTPAAEMAAATRELFLRVAGDPARYGAPAPDPDPGRGGVSLSQHYLSLVAEGRVDVRPWVAGVDGTTVTFTDQTTVAVDALILGTGFDLHLPFLDEAIRSTVQATGDGLQLSEFTFHPDLPGLAFLGLWAQRGAYPVVLEQQARYLAYTWGGRVPAPTDDDLRRGLPACAEAGHHQGYRQQSEMAIRFARLAGVDPGTLDDADLQRVLALSAVTGETFRLVGPDARPDAEQVVRADFARYAPGVLG